MLQTLCAHTLRFETVTWTHNTYPTCDLSNANEVQDDKMSNVSFFTATHAHVVSLRRTYAFLFPPTGFWARKTISCHARFMQCQIYTAL